METLEKPTCVIDPNPLYTSTLAAHIGFEHSSGWVATQAWMLALPRVLTWISHTGSLHKPGCPLTRADYFAIGGRLYARKTHPLNHLAKAGWEHFGPRRALSWASYMGLALGSFDSGYHVLRISHTTLAQCTWHVLDACHMCPYFKKNHWQWSKNKNPSNITMNLIQKFLE